MNGKNCCFSAIIVLVILQWIFFLWGTCDSKFNSIGSAIVLGVTIIILAIRGINAHNHAS